MVFSMRFKVGQLGPAVHFTKKTVRWQCVKAERYVRTITVANTAWSIDRLLNIYTLDRTELAGIAGIGEEIVMTARVTFRCRFTAAIAMCPSRPLQPVKHAC